MIKVGDQIMDDSFDDFTIHLHLRQNLRCYCILVFGKIMDKNFFKNSKNMAALVFATIVFGINKECLRPQLYLNTKVLTLSEVPRGFQSERDTMIKDLGSINVIVEASRNIVLQDFT